MTSARVWLAGHTGQPAARRFARANALGAIAASVAGNAAYHAIGAGLLAVTWPVVVLVGAVPATVLGLTAHLHALRSRTVPAQPRDRAESGNGSGTLDRPESRPRDRAEAGAPGRPGAGTESRAEDRPRSGPTARPASARSRPRPSSRRRPRYRTEADLMTAARDAATRYRHDHGRPITRDALRVALRISGPRATELRRILAQPAGPDPATPFSTAPDPAAPPEHDSTPHAPDPAAVDGSPLAGWPEPDPPPERNSTRRAPDPSRGRPAPRADRPEPGRPPPEPLPARTAAGRTDTTPAPRPEGGMTQP